MSGEDDSLNAIFEDRNVEVDDQTKVAACCLEVGDHLGLVNGRNRGDRLQLHDNQRPHQQIELAFSDEYALVIYSRGLLTLEGDFAKPGPRCRWTSMAAPITAWANSSVLRSGSLRLFTVLGVLGALGGFCCFRPNPRRFSHVGLAQNRWDTWPQTFRTLEPVY